MAAVPYVTVKDFADNLNYLCEAEPNMATIQAAIAIEILANPIWLTETLDLTELNDILRRLTGMVVALDPDINCYPRGADLVQCFDLDGHEIP